MSATKLGRILALLPFALLLLTLAVGLAGCGPVLWHVIPHATPLF